AADGCAAGRYVVALARPAGDLQRRIGDPLDKSKTGATVIRAAAWAAQRDRTELAGDEPCGFELPRTARMIHPGGKFGRDAVLLVEFAARAVDFEFGHRLPVGGDPT